jgi:hypothetical protein
MKRDVASEAASVRVKGGSVAVVGGEGGAALEDVEDFFAVDGEMSGGGEAEADLVSTNIDDDDFDVGVQLQFFIPGHSQFTFDIRPFVRLERIPQHLDSRSRHLDVHYSDLEFLSKEHALAGLAAYHQHGFP